MPHSAAVKPAISIVNTGARTQTRESLCDSSLIQTPWPQKATRDTREQLSGPSGEHRQGQNHTAGQRKPFIGQKQSHAKWGGLRHNSVIVLCDGGPIRETDCSLAVTLPAPVPTALPPTEALDAPTGRRGHPARGPDHSRLQSLFHAQSFSSFLLPSDDAPRHCNVN
ncbi:unnamed protein product [Pleuronectes platessa]|uniref:Uncharacterized protein n=1 Tax=Pleuronectes platessa TaxID=8262 RepID=A0A9N7UPS7_PLEPL|nr:unnamed protein product [Pleuronectes platessa]